MSGITLSKAADRLRRPVKFGFTLIELMVVIAIIALLAATLTPQVMKWIEEAKISQTIADIGTVEKAVIAYRLDTDRYPPNYRLNDTLNPLVQDPGVTGWDGPYVQTWRTRHAWGGHLGWEYFENPNGTACGYILFDDDIYGTNWSNNQGMIPTDVLERIDLRLDDGDLTTGIVRGDGYAIWPPGEFAYQVVWQGCP